MVFTALRKLACSGSLALLALLVVTSIADPAYAQLSRDRDSSSSRNSRDRSSDSDDDDDEGFSDDDDDDNDSDRRSSRSSRSSSRSDSSSSRRSSRRSSSGSRGKSANAAPPAVVFGQSYERLGVRPRGTLLSMEAFEALPCAPEKATVGTNTYYRCGGVWYNQVNHEGWVCYSEIYPPAGVTESSLPKSHESIRAGDRTLLATSDAFYEAVRYTDGRTRYVVVEPAVGMTLDRLPAHAKEGIPVQSGRHTYYRYLGVFYREDESTGKARYVAAPNPFMPQQTAAAATPQSGAAAAASPAGVPPPATATVTFP
jgi:hypothetical protein